MMNNHRNKKILKIEKNQINYNKTQLKNFCQIIKLQLILIKIVIKIKFSNNNERNQYFIFYVYY